ncbi:DUF502 domain-containing protein [bacterium]|nr:DUF502 domain-containing protein [bacterium]
MPHSHTNKILHRMRRTLLAGLLVLAPITLTAYILFKLFGLLDSLLRETVIRFIAIQILNRPDNIDFPGVGILGLIGLLLVTGSLTRNFLGKRILALGDFIVGRIPLANRLYKAIREIAEAILSEKREIFKKAVLFEYPRKGLWSIGFFTQDTTGPVQNALEEDVVSIFLPTTPNPTSGFLLFVPKTSIIELNISVEEAMKLIISGGALHLRGEGKNIAESLH